MAKKKQIKNNISLSALGSKYPGAGILADIRVDDDEELWVPSSSPVMNYLLGGGAAYGRIMEIAGKESSGKSLLAMDFVRSAQALGGVGIYIDAEHAFSARWAELNDLDLDNLFIFPENAIEVISDFVAESSIYWRSQLTENEPIVLVIDSIAALDTLEAMNTSEASSKAEMGIRAKALYKMLRLRNRLWAKLGISVILINQLRDTIATGFAAKFQDKNTTPGGNALKFYSSQRVFLEAKKQLTTGSKEKKHRYGIEVMVTIKKNKLSMPKVPRRVEVTFDPDYGSLGFNRYDGLGDILVNEGVVIKSGNSYSFDGEVIAGSSAALQKELETNKELRAEILEEAKILTVGQIETRLGDIVENRYPVESVAFTSYSSSSSEEEDEDDE